MSRVARQSAEATSRRREMSDFYDMLFLSALATGTGLSVGLAWVL